MDMAVMQKIVDSLSVKELLAVKEKIEERLVRKRLVKMVCCKVHCLMKICRESIP